MFIIQEKLVSQDIIDKKFICNLNVCKGACCWEGDFGAPLEKEELVTLEDIFEDLKSFLSEDSIRRIEDVGLYEWNEEPQEYGTTLMQNGACVFMTVNELGIAGCGIERAHRAGAIEFKKPISCHLYPIRVTKNEETNFEALNYDVWDICSAACKLGEEEQVAVFEFLKEPLIRKYGIDFYEELKSAAEYYRSQQNT